MIQFFHVHKSYGRNSQALVDVSFNVGKGEFIYLMGPSGAGKTTLLKLIFGAQKPDRGQLVVGGRNIARLKARHLPQLRRSVGVVFQDFKLLNRRTVHDNVAVALEVTGLPQREIRRRTYMMLKRVGLAHKLHQHPLELSGGEQQRVAIARALVGEPQILLADEPTGNLDRDRTNEIVGLLEAANARGTTVVLATHDPGLVMASRRVLALNQGRLT